MIDKRMKKRVAIISVYLCGGIIGILLFNYLFGAPASCSDRKMNQGEKGVDCGGPCAPCQEIAQAGKLSVVEKAITPGGKGTYDAAFRVENPNAELGLSDFSYEIVLKDISGLRIASSSGRSYILPGEKKYVTIIGLKVDGVNEPVYMDVNLGEQKWQGVTKSIKGVQLNANVIKYGKVPGSDTTEVQAIVRNESDYDFDKVNIVVVVRNEEGRIIALNATEKNTMRSKEERDFRLVWPYVVGGDVSRVTVEGYANILDSKNVVSR